MGIRRKRSGSGFSYHWPNGRRVADPETLTRIKALVIPPAWSVVWIAGSAECHLQATGRDARGRKQYRYHERWIACRDEVKYSNLIEFAHRLPRLRQTIDGDLGRRGVERERVLAAVVWLLENTMIRVGNPAYARDNNSFGLTTFHDRHVQVDGSTLRFMFRGKSGKEWKLKVTDRRIAKIVKGVQDLPGQRLFQYPDQSGTLRTVISQDVNAYIRDAAGGPFTSKLFRTWGGTVRAASLLAGSELSDTKHECVAATNRVIDAVAARRGNTRAVCRKCYIHPLVLTTWSEGRLTGELAAIRRRYRRTPDGFDRAEYVVLRWLEQAERGSP